MKVSELKKIIRRAGCKKVREGANHEVWLNPNTGMTFTVPRHNSQELPTGTANNILRSAGVR